MKTVLRELSRLLARGEDAALATIVGKSGSAPRSGGSKMLVRADGSSVGSVGGGVFEADTLARAARALSGRRAELRAFDLSDEDAAGTAMICGGRGELLLDFATAGEPADVEVFTEASAMLETAQGGWLLTWLDDGPGAGPRHGLLGADGGVLGRAGEEGALAARLAPATGRRSVVVETFGRSRVVAEPLATPARLLVFGAGHCAHALVPLAESVGFRAEVLDDRAEFVRRERFPGTAALTVLESFERLPEREIDAETYVVIMTRGHVRDRVVLEQCLRTAAGYVGMIGSVRKRDTTFAALREAGFGETDLARVHTPIGVEIEADTPEEIAISIAAELIQARARLEHREKRRRPA